MSISVTNGSSNNATYAGSLGTLTGHPLTISCWLYRTSLTGNRTAVMYGDGGGSDNHSVSISSSSLGEAYATARNASTGVQAATASTALESAWHHYAGVWANTSSRISYLDGSASSENTTALGTLNSFDALIIGQNHAGTLNWVGHVGHLAIWKSVLTAGQITSLAGGANPQTIDASNLVAYYPFTNAADVGEDIIGGYDLTLNGTAAYNSENPTVNAYSAAKRIVPVNFIRSQSATASGS